MKLSVMLFPFHAGMKDGDIDVAPSLRQMKDAGVTGIEANLPYADQTPALWRELLHAASDLGLAHACFDIGVNLIGESAADRQEAVDTVVRSVDICRDIGCQTALVHGTRPSQGMTNDEGRKIYSEQLAKAAEGVEGSGVTLTIEDYGVYPEFSCSSRHVLDIVEGTGRDDVKVTFDNGNFMLADEEPMDAYPVLIDRTVHVHLKDWESVDPEAERGLVSPGGTRYVGCEIGEGTARVGEVTQRLRSDGYDGWLSLEVSTSPPLEAAITGAENVTRAWTEA
ncbi:MAG: sugar phosphate isomerase/epimerase family protein [Armatimonadota bacterium]